MLAVIDLGLTKGYLVPDSESLRVSILDMFNGFIAPKGLRSL